MRKQWCKFGDTRNDIPSVYRLQRTWLGNVSITARSGQQSPYRFDRVITLNRYLKPYFNWRTIQRKPVLVGACCPFSRITLCWIVFVYVQLRNRQFLSMVRKTRNAPSVNSSSNRIDGIKKNLRTEHGAYEGTGQFYNYNTMNSVINLNV